MGRARGTSTFVVGRSETGKKMVRSSRDEYRSLTTLPLKRERDEEETANEEKIRRYFKAWIIRREETEAMSVRSRIGGIVHRLSGISRHLPRLGSPSHDLTSPRNKARLSPLADKTRLRKSFHPLPPPPLSPYSVRVIKHFSFSSSLLRLVKEIRLFLISLSFSFSGLSVL